MKTLQYIISIVLAVIILASCSPQKRLNRLVALHPELVQNDTIHIRDTTIIPATRIDTSFHESKLNDTIIITKEKLRVKIHSYQDSIYVYVHQEADTVVVEKEIVVDRIVKTHKSNCNFNKQIAKIIFYLIFVSACIWLLLGILFGWKK